MARSAEMATDRKRLAPAERREQLVRVAMAVVAEGGAQALTFDGVAQRAGVTRNLLYHYFPDGTADLLRAAAEVAGADLVAGWTIDEAVPLAERRARNFQAMLHHAAQPTDAWAVSRVTSVAADPALEAITARYRDHIVCAMSLNAFGTTTPTPIQRAALESYQAFAETLLDRARDRDLDGAAVLGLLLAMLDAAVAAAG
jgi:AcrR family transcriptional regulator